MVCVLPGPKSAEHINETQITVGRRILCVRTKSGTRRAIRSRYLTHMKKLKDPRKPLERLLDRVSVLGNKLGPILFQLPLGGGRTRSGWKASLRYCPRTNDMPSSSGIPAGS